MSQAKNVTDAELVLMISHAILNDPKDTAKEYGRSIRTVQRYIKKAIDEPEWYLKASAALLIDATPKNELSQREIVDITTRPTTVEDALLGILSYIERSAQKATPGNPKVIHALNESYDKLANVKLANELIQRMIYDSTAPSD